MGILQKLGTSLLVVAATVAFFYFVGQAGKKEAPARQDRSDNVYGPMAGVKLPLLRQIVAAYGGEKIFGLFRDSTIRMAFETASQRKGKETWTAIHYRRGDSIRFDQIRGTGKETFHEAVCLHKGRAWRMVNDVLTGDIKPQTVARLRERRRGVAWQIDLLDLLSGGFGKFDIRQDPETGKSQRVFTKDGKTFVFDGDTLLLERTVCGNQVIYYSDYRFLADRFQYPTRIVLERYRLASGETIPLERIPYPLAGRYEIRISRPPLLERVPVNKFLPPAAAPRKSK